MSVPEKMRAVLLNDFGDRGRSLRALLAFIEVLFVLRKPVDR